jgi:hypothetical protein
VLTTFCLGYVHVTDGTGELIAASVVGANVTMAIFSWMLGDVRALSHLRGAIGEEQTASLLTHLDQSIWTVDHDRRSMHGNWDHIVIGPAGVYVIDSKNLSGSAKVVDDALVSGRLRFSGGSFRAAAAELSEALKTNGRRPWVQPIVAIWGEFPQEHVERDGVIYLAAERLVPYLTSTVRPGS